MKNNLGVALVTGISSGIGNATAKALQSAGFRVFGTSRRAASKRSDGITMLTCDVTDDASVAKLVDHLGGLPGCAIGVVLSIEQSANDLLRRDSGGFFTVGAANIGGKGIDLRVRPQH